MGPLGVVKADPVANDPFGLEAVAQLVQIDRLIFERPPKPFDKDIVHVSAPAIHGDRDLRILEDAGELEAGELTALIGVEDFRLAISDQRFVQRLDAEPDIHGIRQPPGENMARRPVHDRHQIQESPAIMNLYYPTRVNPEVVAESALGA